MRPAAIPSYALYGEDQSPDQPDFLHIETIAARSTLHDWEIAPHRHAGFVQVLLVREGHVRVSFDGVESEQGGPLAVVAPAGTVHGFRFSEGTAGWVLTLPGDFTARAEGPADPLQALLLRGGTFALDPAAAPRAAWLAGEMLALQETARAQAPLLRALAEAMVRSLVRPEPGAGEAATHPRLERFRQLVETHYREHRDLDFYASALGLTRRSLSRLTADRLGCAPITVLHRRLATEARRLLRYTGASAAQIAAELGFEDPSYFSRFYVRMTGKRPGEERG
jgi:AraC family transcriptional regulator, transcriptional activator of pobA